MADTPVGQRLVDLLPERKVIVICGRGDDARAWRSLLGARCLAIPLDEVPRQHWPAVIRGVSDQLTWQHRAIADLDGTGWLAPRVNRFDPDKTAALVLPDPLDPPAAGARRRF